MNPIELPPKPVEMISKVTDYATQLNALVIETAEDAGHVSDFEKWLKALKKKATDECKSFTDPLNETIRRLKAQYEPAITACDAGIAASKAKLLTHAHRVEREARLAREQEEARFREAERVRLANEAAALAMAEKAAARGDADGAEAIVNAVLAVPETAPVFVAAAGPVRGELGSVSSIRRTWDFEVMDELVIPRAYLAVDPQSIRRAVMAGAREIPGVRIYQKESITTR